MVVKYNIEESHCLVIGRIPPVSVAIKASRRCREDLTWPQFGKGWESQASRSAGDNYCQVGKCCEQITIEQGKVDKFHGKFLWNIGRWVLQTGTIEHRLAASCMEHRQAGDGQNNGGSNLQPPASFPIILSVKNQHGRSQMAVGHCNHCKLVAKHSYLNITVFAYVTAILRICCKSPLFSIIVISNSCWRSCCNSRTALTVLLLVVYAC